MRQMDSVLSHKLFNDVTHGVATNRGVSPLSDFTLSRDICWPVQQLDYFRYTIIKQHILTFDLTLKNFYISVKILKK